MRIAELIGALSLAADLASGMPSEKGLRSDEQRAYLKCVKLDGKFAACHYGLFEVFQQDRREKDARTACENFVRFADPSEMKPQIATCERFLRSAR